VSKDEEQRPEPLSTVKQALQKIMQLQRELDTERQRRTESIAIVGMACRVPGAARTPTEFWNLLVNGVDAISEISPKRQSLWANNGGEHVQAARVGGYIDDIDQFDASFFGISPREASQLDPQQRLLLECTWEALERAGLSAHRLAGSRGGVFISSNASEYLFLQSADTQDVYSAAGSARSVAAGRLSYFLDWTGPSLAVDTACSSSLVAVHLACESLRRGESNVALAGGVQLCLNPASYVALSKAGLLSASGRCRAFDRDADGFVRAEGCGVLILKRLSQAQQDGDRIFAVIRGSATNQDGRSQGLTAPNGPAQEAVIRDALNHAAIEPSAIDYVEAHGTGTPLGDSIEMGALANVFGKSHSKQRRLIVGAVKANLGNLEAAGSIVGLIKVVLALQNEQLPKQLHFRNHSLHIDWERIPVRVPDQAIPWPRQPQRARRAGVSAFGFGGTNAHLIVEEAPLSTLDKNPIDRPTHLLCLSAQSETALMALIGRYLEDFSDSRFSLADLCHTASVGRSHFRFRAGVRANTPDMLCAGLRSLHKTEDHAGIFRGEVRETRSRVAFLFSGCEEDLASTRIFYETEPRFKTAIDRCNDLLGVQLGAPLPALPWDNDDAGPLNLRHSMAAIFSVEYALSELWTGFGVTPDMILFHGIGVYAAACMAGVYALKDACALIAERISDSASPMVDRIDYRQPQTRIASTEWADGPSIASPSFWASVGGRTQNPLAKIEIPKSFGEDICLLVGTGTPIVSEGGPRPLPMMRSGSSPWDTTLDVLAKLYVDGYPVDWASVDRPFHRARIDLPTYPFQNQRYWVEGKARDDCRQSFTHPLLGRAHRAPGRSLAFQSAVSERQPAYLADHRVHDSAVFPGAGYIEMLLAAGAAELRCDALILTDFLIATRLTLPDDVAVTLYTGVERGSEGLLTASIQSLSDSEHSIWQLHAQASLRPLESVNPQIVQETLDIARARCCRSVDSVSRYAALALTGLEYGASFQALAALHIGGSEALGEIELPAGLGAADYRVHPVLLDAALQTCGAIVPSEAVYMPVGFDRLTYLRNPGRRATAHARLRSSVARDGRESVLDLTLYEETGAPCLAIEGLRMRRADRVQKSPASRATDLVHEIIWREQSMSVQAVPRGGVLVLADQSGFAANVVECLTAHGISVEVIDAKDVRTIETLIARGSAPESIVNLAAWDFREGDRASFELVREFIADALRLADAFVARRWSPRLLWVTCHGQSITGFERIEPVLAALAAAARVIENKHPEIRSTTLDLETSDDRPALARIIVDELGFTATETRIAYRAGVRYAARLTPSKLGESRTAALPQAPFSVRLRAYGELGNLHFVEGTPRVPARGEVQVAVRAAALNFKEVVVALGLLPGDAPQRAEDLSLGAEYAGYVSAIGEGVAGVSVGDAVFGLADDSLATHVTVAADRVMAIPPRLSFEQAAALPTVFLSAYYALVHCAKVKAGDRVLIHAGAGGVGQAALQIAKGLGAEIYVTASPAKWAFLREQGCLYTYSSRTFDFSEQLRRDTQGEGVDVVLNCLNGEFIPRSFDVLKSAGRFVELGKRDIWSTQEAAHYRDDVDYHHFDLHDILARRPALYREMLGAVLAGFGARRYHPLPIQRYPVESVISAFRDLAQAKHVGKIVIRLPAISNRGETAYDLIRADRTYLVNGESGVRIAEQLVRRGARHFLLLTRRELDAVTKTAIERLRQAGSDVRWVRLDNTDVEMSGALRREIEALRCPLGGVIYAAAPVQEPALQDVACLDALTRENPLDFFICFSPAASLLSRSGDIHDTAASAYLDALMRRRRQRGQVGLSVANTAGLDDGLAALDYLLPRANKHYVTLRQASGTESNSPFLSECRTSAAHDRAVAATSQNVVAAAISARASDRRPLIDRYVRETVAARLGLEDASLLSARGRLFDLGVDSLVSVELRNIFQKDLQRNLPATLLLDYPNVDALTQYFLADVLHLDDGAARQPSLAVPEPIDTVSRHVAALSEHEVEDMMLERLRELGA
jgi:acyl transferase domain-containing protein/NADPH:quinone reductase-like Zn-dependent oxidoreductase/acyl carrier protein